MGGCPSNCEIKCGNGLRYDGSALELNFEQTHQKIERKNRSESGSRQGESTLPATNFKKEYESEWFQTPSDPKNELFPSNMDNELIPVFAKNKQIHHTSYPMRNNRFIQDLEIEVKERIKEIQQQERQEIENLWIKELVKRQLEFEKLKEQNQNRNQYLDQNSQNKKETETLKNLKLSVNNSKSSKESPKDSYQSQSAYSDKHSLSQNVHTESIKINSKQQKAAFEKLASSYYAENRSQNSINTKKGILKSKTSLKYANTSRSLPNKVKRNGYKKRVHFSHDTNFNFEKKNERISQKSWWQVLF